MSHLFWYKKIKMQCKIVRWSILVVNCAKNENEKYIYFGIKGVIDNSNVTVEK